MGNPAELRLALVCYGGVSLAVYMHGVTKELQSLIRAARKFDDAWPEKSENPFSTGTEAAYFDALRDLADRGHPFSVSIDIIGGTSAGGINGIALSKGLAHGASQEPLKKVWIEDGDIRRLLRAPAFAGLLAQAFFAATHQVVRLSSATSPLRGELMARLILGALESMDKAPHEATLMPKGGTLELFVPATDLDGFEVLVPSGAGGASQRDRHNAQVFKFCSEDGQFGQTFTPDLAFAARASASFPGAFAPVSQESFRKETRRDELTFHSSVFHYNYSSPDHAKKVYFVDGGVLDNAPFDVVISAIGRRRADSEVYRRIAYIEPDPGRDLYSATVEAPSSRRRWLKDLMAVSKVKGNHPILRELLALRDMNGRIGEVSAIAERQSAYVIGAIACIRNFQRDPRDVMLLSMKAGDEGATKLMEEVTSEDDIKKLSNDMHIWAKDALGPTFSTYQRLKFDAVTKPLANELADRFGYSPQSGQASFIRAATIEWARQQTFWSEEPNSKVGEPPGDTLGKKLQPIDVPYRERRLMFILAGVNEMYSPTDKDGKHRDPPPRDDLDKLKGVAWDLLGRLRDTPKAVVHDVKKMPDETVEFLRLKPPHGPNPDRRDDPMLADPATFATEHTDEFEALLESYSTEMCKQLGGGSTDLWTAFVDNTAGWDHWHRQALLSRYLGFPLWDGMIFPTLSLTEVPQLTPIGVSQFSPLMATKLKPPPDEKGAPTEKLKGIPVSHFAGFFNAKSRENDYLWGRLDGAELILRLLQEVVESKAPSKDGAQQRDKPIPYLAAALRAVLDTETDLKRISKLWEGLQEQVTNLAAAEAAVTHTGAARGATSRLPAAPDEGGQDVAF